MIWWIWTAYIPAKIHVFDVNEAWNGDEFEFGGLYTPDVAWLGETAWTARCDSMGLGLLG